MADSSASSSTAPSQLHNKQRTLDKWIEPSLPEPVPSYKDLPNLTLPPYGVLTNMAPLGTLPNSKMQKMAKTETAAKVKPTNGEASASSISTPMEENMTPDPIPHPNTRRSQSHIEEEMDCRTPATPTALNAGSAQQVVTNGTRPNLTNASRASSQTSYTPLSTRPQLSIPRPTASLFTTSGMPRPPIRIEQVVLSAIRMSRGAGRHHTAFALTDLITHHRDDPNVERVLKAVANSEGNIHPNLMAEFSTMVQQKKRESRRKGLPERRASSSTTFAAPNIRFATPSYNSPSKMATTVSESPAEEPPSESRSSTKRPSQSPNKDYGHVSKKLKSNNFEQEKEAEEADPPSNIGSSMQPSLSDASRSSSPLSELDDIDELLLQGGNFAPNEKSTSEERASIAEIHARVRPASTRKSAIGGPKLRTYIPNSSNMAVAASPSPSSSTFPPNNHPPKSHKKNASALPQRLDPNDAREILRRRARDVTNGEPISESDVRTPMTSLEVESESEEADSSIAPSRPAPSGLRLRLRNIPKGPANDESDKSSPTFLPFQHDLVPTSSTNSRQSTPNPYGRPTRKAKTGPRVKSSPMKNRAVPLAGISRASGERNSPVGNGGFGLTQDDNHDDYCSSCGGGGMIVCCDGDGCRRSYHWLCLDPPRREEDVDSTESVYCCSCTAGMRTATKRAQGLFASLLNSIERKNPVAFRLSKDITEYFEGVKTGPQGEYEDILPANHKTKNRAGYEEAPDYLRLKDNKGNIIMCHQCLRSAASGQPIIPCSFCSLHWHLDCLDPPLANPPTRDRPWKCPCHVDDLLDKIPGMLGPAHRYRKIKGAPAMRPAAARTVRNNGRIEVENSPSDDEEDISGFYNQNVFGKEYRLPEHGIKLQFLSKIKRDNKSNALKRKRDEELPLPPIPTTEPLSMRALHEQQAALNLAALASRAVDFQAHDQLPNLINVLIAERPDEVVSMMAQADATNLEKGVITENEKVSLETLAVALASLLKEVHALQGKKSDGDADVKENDEEKEEEKVVSKTTATTTTTMMPIPPTVVDQQNGDTIPSTAEERHVDQANVDRANVDTDGDEYMEGLFES